MREGAASSVLEAHDVSRRFDRRWALRRVTAAFHPGETVAIVGHNGAGKSTLMGLLAGTLTPTEGVVTCFGHDRAEHPDPGGARQKTAVLAHIPWTYPDLSGFENLRFFTRLAGQPDDAEAFEALLDRVGLSKAAHHPARTYSRGMTQRLGLARILGQNAKLWLLDEPTTGLDTAGRQMAIDLIHAAKASGICVIAVTHDAIGLGAAMDRTLQLNRGRLEAP